MSAKTEAILVLNAGSSSIKFSLFSTAPGDSDALLAKGALLAKRNAAAGAR